mmetsp:Transcript_24426/g.74537  ORF Transcript_24426/g.74537 Transcript_24426/m.74537 type:complete len:95 (+) Transcript_24426:71-355(+)
MRGATAHTQHKQQSSIIEHYKLQAANTHLQHIPTSLLASSCSTRVSSTSLISASTSCSYLLPANEPMYTHVFNNLSHVTHEEAVLAGQRRMVLS